MAKTVNCAFCNKEIQKGLFGGNAETLEIADSVKLDCCEECAAKYRVLAAIHFLRFSTKLSNYKWVNRAKPSTKEIVSMYIKYLNEAQAYKERVAGEEASYQSWFFESNESGFFGISERKLGFMASDISRDDKIASFKSDIITDFGFTKDDITCIKFRLKGGDFNGLFHKIYSLEICLNEEKGITYRPCYAITAVEGGGFMFGYRHFAKKHAREYLEDFRKRIYSDLPIYEVRKFR